MNFLSLLKMIPGRIWIYVAVVTAALSYHYGVVGAKNLIISSLESKIEKCQKEKETLTHALSEQNKAISEFAQAARSQADEMKKLQTTINKQKRQTKTAVDQILKGPTPKTCQEAINYLVDGVKERKK